MFMLPYGRRSVGSFATAVLISVDVVNHPMAMCACPPVPLSGPPNSKGCTTAAGKDTNHKQQQQNSVHSAAALGPHCRGSSTTSHRRSAELPVLVTTAG